MRYLYFPTTTLNFNNILSTGSIAPAAVYTARRFGYNKFEVVPPNPFQNVLLLYARYPVFSVLDADRDNYPLVIRIRADRLFDANYAIRDINVYDKTIYLDPVSTEFLFATPEAKKITLIKAEPSLTTKLVGLYQSHMQAVSFAQVDSFNWLREMLDNISDGSSEAAFRNCELDVHINRLKGFVCGYMLGAYKSLDKKVARFRSVIKEQRNEISAMLNDPSRGNQERFRRALESCTTLDDLWSAEGIGRQRFESEQGDRIVNDRGQIAGLEYRHESDKRSSQLLIKLFNTYCLTSNFTGQLVEYRFNVAMDGAKAIKNLMGSEWETGSHKPYLTDLVNNVKSGSEFDFNLSDSLLLRSFAAFVLKGDDFDKLESFLVDQGIGDFRIAFALWGGMFGFSKIPKTAYTLPELRGDFSYMKKMHNYVHSVVHAIPLRDLEEKVSQRNLQAVSVVIPGCGTAPLELTERIQLQVPDAERWMPSIAEQLKENGNDFTAWFQKAKTTDLGGRSKGKMDDVKKDVMRVVRNFFSGELEAQNVPPQQPSLLLDSNRQVKFWGDPYAWEIIKYVVPPVYQNDIKTDLKWFQKNWIDPNSDYYGWQNKKSKSRISDKDLEQRTNYDAIEYFVRFLKNTRQRRLKESREFLTESAIEKIGCLLSGRYC